MTCTATFQSAKSIGTDGGVNTYAYVGGNPVSATDPSGTGGPGSFFGIGFGGGGISMASAVGAAFQSLIAAINPYRWPDFIQFSLDLGPANLNGTFSASGNSFAGAGVSKGYPDPISVGGSVAAGWLNQYLPPSGKQIDDFIGGWGAGSSEYFLGVGGGVAWSPGNGTATLIGVGAGFTGGVGQSWNQGSTGLGSWR